MSNQNFPKSIEVIVNGEKLRADLREFSTGSKGYNISQVVNIGNGHTARVGCNIVITGTKPKQ